MKRFWKWLFASYTVQEACDAAVEEIVRNGYGTIALHAADKSCIGWWVSYWVPDSNSRIGRGLVSVSMTPRLRVDGFFEI